ncbi:MAG: protein-tyrosine phosphatase family protein [Candidatus Hodarchaeota archaeon]
MSINQIIKWIIPGKLAGSPFPLSKELFILPELNLMLVVNLTSRGLPNSLKERLKSSGVTFKRFSVPDFSIPTQDTIKYYLQIVCETLQQEQAVLTHCIAGCGRTGTMIGLFLVTHGYKSIEALKIIHEALGEGCPETGKQLALLHQYRKKCPNYSQCKGQI